MTVSYDPSDSSKVFVKKFINGTNLGNTPPENDPTLDGHWSIESANGPLLLADKMARRAPGSSAVSTLRSCHDVAEISAGSAA